MDLLKPKFFDSEYCYIDDDGWHLKENAPQNIKDEFNEYKAFKILLNNQKK